MRRSSFSRSHSKVPLKQQHRLRPPPSSTTALHLGNDVDEEARSDSNLNIDQRVKHLTGMTETDIACMQAEGIANEEDLRNIKFDDLPDSLPVVKRRKLNLVSRYLAAGNELNDTITMIQVQQTVETVIAATSSFVDISFDSASNVVTLIFDGDTGDPVRASASDMMKDLGISEVRTKDNSKPRGINMDTLVLNKKMVGGFINFDGQKYTINSSKNVGQDDDMDLSKLSHSEVVAKLQTIAETFKQAQNDEEDPKGYRYPEHPHGTWSRDEIQTELRNKQNTIHERLQRYNKRGRESLVIGMRLGSGYGKTHLLTEAPELIDAQGLFITYHMDQNLDRDKQNPVESLLIRLMLVACGCNQQNCGIFLSDEQYKTDSRSFRRLGRDFLRTCFLELTKKTLEWGDIMIGVDEVMLLVGGNLDNNKVRCIISELGELSQLYTNNEPKSKCTCIVTSLQDKAFQTNSGRPVEDWSPLEDQTTAIEYFAGNIPDAQRKEKFMALANAVCGNHLRSIVLAFEEFQNVETCTVASLSSKINGMIGNKARDSELEQIRTYVKNCLLCKDAPAPPDEVQPYVGRDNAVVPVIMTKAFEGHCGQGQLNGLLNSFSMFDGGPSKQLEVIGTYYDLLRAELGMPVVPEGAVLHGISSINEEQWFREVFHHINLEENKQDLLKTVGVGESKTVDFVGIKPEWGQYYHPDSSTHPWFDRLVIGRHTNGSECMIIYQDKINKNVPKACDDLSNAANLLMKKTGIENVLLVLNVVGASDRTRKQNELDFPYILVCDSEIRSFYSLNFASMVEFARRRHELSFGV